MRNSHGTNKLPEREREIESQLWRQELRQRQRVHSAYADADAWAGGRGLSLEQPSFVLCKVLRESAHTTQCERGRMRMRTRTKADGDVGAVTDLGSTCPLSAFSTVVGGGCPSVNVTVSVSVSVSPEHFFPVYFVPCFKRNPQKTPPKRKILYNVFIIIYLSRTASRAEQRKHRVKCIQNLWLFLLVFFVYAKNAKMNK